VSKSDWQGMSSKSDEAPATPVPAGGKPEKRLVPATPEQAPAPVHRMGAVKNAPVVTNTGGYELKVVPAKPEVMAMAGHNQGGYENRVFQEAGTH